jgi:hypothetical protein
MRPFPEAAALFRHGAAVAAGFVIVAVIVRAPALLYSVLNYDESMYLLMGLEFARGHLPYTTVCDLKPFGLFALATPFAASPFDPVISSRIGASVVVGLTAYLLCRISSLLFSDERRLIGISAGLGYVVFSLADGGMAFQGEIFHTACAVLALLLALRAVHHRMPPSLGAMIAAGLVLGIGIQIKQSVLFDMLAFLAGFFILTTPSWRDLRRHAQANLRPLIALGLAAPLPTLVVMALYAGAGHWDAWVAANITAHSVFYAGDRELAWLPALWSVAEQAPLWIGALLAAVFVRRLTIGGREFRAAIFLGIWVFAIVLCQLFLRIASDHYFLQFLPPLSLLGGLVIGRGLLIYLPGWRPVGVALAMLAGLTVFAVAKNPIMHSFHIVKDRLAGDAWAGDTPRRITADLKPLLEPDDAIYVVGFQPAIYYLTGAVIPTRFAFTGMPSARIPGRDGCPWIEPAVEMRRILDSRPRFIVIERGIFYAEMPLNVRQMLDERLAQDYWVRARYEQHFAHQLYPFERFVMNGGAPADVYELQMNSAPAQVQIGQRQAE